MTPQPLFQRWCLALTLLCLGCKTATRLDPTTTTRRPATDIVMDFAPGESIPAVFELQIDPVTLSATATPLTSRSGSGFQASQYDLDIANFSTPAQFSVRSVRFTFYGDLEISFRHAHPWGAVDVAEPPSASNRADLGYTGRLLILADVPPDELTSHTFFGDVIANTELVRGADGFVQPGDLLAKGGFNTNCFPYVLLADEAKDNRIGVSNGGVVTGNWDPAVGGWQRSNLGPNGDGWTGYDFVHAGQTIENTFVLNRDELTDSPITLQVALLIKYTEPKGVGGEAGRALRLPPETEDVLQFAYRAPHAALDCSSVESSSNEPSELSDALRQIEETPGATATVTMRVRDWDAAAPEAGAPDVSITSDVEAIEPGTAGWPLLEIDCPALSAAPVSLVNNTPDRTGMADEFGLFFYEGEVVNVQGAPAGQIVPGLVRGTDAADGLSTGSFHFGVDPVTLVPLAAPIPLRTYHGLNFRVLKPPPVWVDHIVDDSGDCGDFPSVVFLDQGTPEPGDDRLALTYRDNAAKKTKLARALVAVPAGPADWSIHILDDQGDNGFDTCLVPYGEGLAVSYMDHGGAGGSVRVAYTPTTSPDSAADWTVSAVATGTGSEAYDTALTVGPDGRLAVMFNHATAQEVQIGLAQSNNPVTAADWLVYPLASTIVEQKTVYTTITTYRDRLMGAYKPPGFLTSPNILLAQEETPLSPENWKEYVLELSSQTNGTTGPPTNFLELGTTLYLGYYGWLCHSNALPPTSRGQWQKATVLAQPVLQLISTDGISPVAISRSPSEEGGLAVWAQKPVVASPRQRGDMHWVPIVPSAVRSSVSNVSACAAAGRIAVAYGHWDNALHLSYNPSVW